MMRPARHCGVHILSGYPHSWSPSCLPQKVSIMAGSQPVSLLCLVRPLIGRGLQGQPQARFKAQKCSRAANLLLAIWAQYKHTSNVRIKRQGNLVTNWANPKCSILTLVSARPLPFHRCRCAVGVFSSQSLPDNHLGLDPGSSRNHCTTHHTILIPF